MNLHDRAGCQYKHYSFIKKFLNFLKIQIVIQSNLKSMKIYIECKNNEKNVMSMKNEGNNFI